MRLRLVVLEVAVWWAAALGIWLLTLSSVDRADLEVAIPCALACAVGAVGVRRALSGDWRWPSGTGRWVRWLLLAVPTDTATVLALPIRMLVGGNRDEGRIIRVPVAPGVEPAPTTRRAAAALLVSCTPGSVVLHDDSDTGELLVHQLVSGPVSMEEVVRR